MGVAHTSNGGGVYVQWGWRIRPMGVAYTSKGAKVAYKSKGPIFGPYVLLGGPLIFTFYFFGIIKKNK